MGRTTIPDDDAEYFASFSTDGGVTWAAERAAERRILQRCDGASGVDYGDYNGTAAYGGIFRPAWADNSNSTGDNPNGTLSRFDVYTAAYPIPSPASAVNEPGPDRSSPGLVPSGLVLSPPVPTPATGPITLRYGLPRAGHVRASVRDVGGREVATLVEGERSAGWHSLRWDGSDDSGLRLAAGVYFVQLTAVGETRVKRTIVIR